MSSELPSTSMTSRSSRYTTRSSTKEFLENLATAKAALLRPIYQMEDDLKRFNVEIIARAESILNGAYGEAFPEDPSSWLSELESMEDELISINNDLVKFKKRLNKDQNLLDQLSIYQEDIMRLHSDVTKMAELLNAYWSKLVAITADPYGVVKPKLQATPLKSEPDDKKKPKITPSDDAKRSTSPAFFGGSSDSTGDIDHHKIEASVDTPDEKMA